MLDEQRTNVLSMIHRGKELVRESDHTPEFLGQLVSSLENEWEEAYSKTVNNLDTLKGMYEYVR